MTKMPNNYEEVLLNAGNYGSAASGDTIDFINNIAIADASYVAAFANVSPMAKTKAQLTEGTELQDLVRDLSESSASFNANFMSYQALANAYIETLNGIKETLNMNTESFDENLIQSILDGNVEDPELSDKILNYLKDKTKGQVTGKLKEFIKLALGESVENSLASYGVSNLSEIGFGEKSMSEVFLTLAKNSKSLASDLANYGLKKYNDYLMDVVYKNAIDEMIKNSDKFLTRAEALQELLKNGADDIDPSLFEKFMVGAGADVVKLGLNTAYNIAFGDKSNGIAECVGVAVAKSAVTFIGGKVGAAIGTAIGGPVGTVAGYVAGEAITYVGTVVIDGVVHYIHYLPGDVDKEFKIMTLEEAKKAVAGDTIQLTKLKGYEDGTYRDSCIVMKNEGAPSILSDLAAANATHNYEGLLDEDGTPTIGAEVANFYYTLNENGNLDYFANPENFGAENKEQVLDYFMNNSGTLSVGSKGSKEEYSEQFWELYDYYSSIDADTRVKHDEAIGDARYFANPANINSF